MTTFESIFFWIGIAGSGLFIAALGFAMIIYYEDRKYTRLDRKINQSREIYQQLIKDHAQTADSIPVQDEGHVS